MPATDYANNLVLNYEFTAVGGNPATYIGLSTTPINEKGEGATEPETSAGYTRRAIGTWTYFHEDGQAYNSSTIGFPAAGTATAPWGTIVEVFLVDAETDGNILYHTKLSPTIPTYTGTQIIINPQTLILTERA